MTAPFTVVGTSEPRWAEPLRELYGFLEKTPLLVVEPDAAELLKLVCNAWHAAKVCFANEVGRLCEAKGIDGQRVMDLFARDARLNLSAAYLRPGFAYGGSCLPKDLGALIHLARSSQLDLPLIDGLPRSNTLHIERAKSKILAAGCRRVGFLGLSFKKGTDDLRGSPQVDLVEFCIGKGFSVRIYDPTVRPDRLVGRNRQEAFERLGHLAELLVPTLEEMTDHAELIVIGHRDGDFAEYCRTLPERVRVLDLVGVIPAAPAR
jgi:GDP-mannose 6-dehydrogenase